MPPPFTPTPVSAAVGPKKDSVELLLEGMPIQQPQPPRTTPQTAGQSSASYHAEHAVRPAHTSPDDMPKVLVERAPQHATVRIDRQRIQAVIDQAQAEKAARQLEAENAQHRAVGMPLSLRIAIAIVAGLAVVLAIFLIARPAVDGPASVAPPPAATVRPPPTVAAAPTAPPAPTASDTSQASQSSTPPATTDTISAAPTAPPPVTTSSAKPKPRATAPAAGSADLGEFKTTFH
jgi:cytoskeletal protein RodZ